MPVDEPTVERLVILVQRLLDSELTTEVQALSLIEEANAVFLHWRIGNYAEARRHARRLELFTEALVHTEAFSQSDGQHVLALARAIGSSSLAPSISGNTHPEETQP
ncbi:MAG TPA: hypothetical protein VK934_09825 [Fimbriimonas sp.]|nr:hypothetical protein [Fimbriimonas sp.]